MDERVERDHRVQHHELDDVVLLNDELVVMLVQIKHEMVEKVETQLQTFIDFI